MTFDDAIAKASARSALYGAAETVSPLFGHDFVLDNQGAFRRFVVNCSVVKEYRYDGDVWYVANTWEIC
jgi:hypothetical protein